MCWECGWEIIIGLLIALHIVSNVGLHNALHIGCLTELGCVLVSGVGLQFRSCMICMAIYDVPTRVPKHFARHKTHIAG